jgi:hypothetical protein
MSVARARLVAGVASAFVLVSIAAGAALGPTSGIVFLIAVVAFATVGVLIVSVRPRNAIGWLFLGTAVLWASGTFATDYAVYVYSGGHESPWATAAAWYGEWYWLPALSLVGIFNAFLFPTGRLPTRRWRPVFVLAVLAIAAFTIVAALDASLEPNDEVKVSNPLGISSLGDVEEGVLGGLLGSSLSGLALIAMVSLVLRFRRSRGEERQQIKWFAYAGVLLVLGWFALIFLEELAGGLGDSGYAVLMSLPPIAAGIAVLRYRLYDIDVVINRTLVYGSVTALLAGSYLGLVLLLQLAFSPLTEGNGVAVALSTLAVAGLFRPARNRVQALVDRRFYRRRYDAQQTLEGFAARLREEVDLDALRAELTGVVAETMQPAHVSLWLKEAPE